MSTVFRSKKNCSCVCFRLKKVQGKKKRDAAVAEALKKVHDEELAAQDEVESDSEPLGDLLKDKDEDIIF